MMYRKQLRVTKARQLGRLTLAKLAKYDDVLTDALTDQVRGVSLAAKPWY